MLETASFRQNENDLRQELEADRGIWMITENGVDIEPLRILRLSGETAELNPYGLKYLDPELYSDSFNNLEADRVADGVGTYVGCEKRLSVPQVE